MQSSHPLTTTLPLLHQAQRGVEGKLRVSIELLPTMLAEQRPAGEGRGEPNTVSWADSD
eukprot:SAG11_NODE_1605_length_4593_cov_2.083667_2_plen_59_part_00